MRIGVAALKRAPINAQDWRKLRMRFLLTPLARTHIASMRLFVSAVDLFRMEPHNEMLSDRTSNEAYCLAEPAKATGRSISTYFPLAAHALRVSVDRDCTVTARFFYDGRPEVTGKKRVRNCLAKCEAIKRRVR